MMRASLYGKVAVNGDTYFCTISLALTQFEGYRVEYPFFFGVPISHRSPDRVFEFLSLSRASRVVFWQSGWIPTEGEIHEGRRWDYFYLSLASMRSHISPHTIEFPIPGLSCSWFLPPMVWNLLLYIWRLACQDGDSQSQRKCLLCDLPRVQWWAETEI